MERALEEILVKILVEIAQLIVEWLRKEVLPDE
jgi:hypothetical protein